MPSRSVPQTWLNLVDSASAFIKRRPIVILSSALFFAVLFTVYESASSTLLTPFNYSSTLPPQPTEPRRYYKGSFDGEWNYARDKNNLLLDSEQCEQAFPGLYEEVDRPVNKRRYKKITSTELDDVVPRNGYIRAMIYDGEVCSMSFRVYNDVANIFGDLCDRNRRKNLLSWPCNITRSTPRRHDFFGTPTKHRVCLQRGRSHHTIPTVGLRTRTQRSGGVAHA